MFQDIVLHDKVVIMGVYADIFIMGKAEVYHVTKDMMRVWIAGNTVDDMIRPFIIQPFATIYLMVSGFWRRQESEVADNTAFILNDEATALLHICSNDGLRWIALSPLVHIAGRTHNLLRSFHHLHNFSYVSLPRFSDYPVHIPFMNCYFMYPTGLLSTNIWVSVRLRAFVSASLSIEARGTVAS